jgi:outer membrane protein TolC
MHGVRVTLLVLMAFTSFSVMGQDQNNVVTLSQCIDEALQNGPDTRLSAASLAASQAAYAATVAQNSFGLDGTGSASRKQPFVNTVPRGVGGESPYVTTGPVLVGTDEAQAGVSLSGPSTSVSLAAGYSLQEQNPLVHSTSMSVTANQTIWDGYVGGLARALVQQAGLTFQQAQVTDGDTRKTIAYNVKQAYYTMLAQQRQINVLHDTLSQRQGELKRVQALMANQDATQIDLKQAEVNQLTAEISLTNAERTLEIDRENLSALVGWQIEKTYTVSEVEDQPVPSLDVNAAVQTALSRRADLKQLQLKRAAGDISLAQKKAQSSPVVKATGGLSWTRDWTDSTDLADWNAGLQVSVPILDAGLTQQQVRQAALQNESFDIQIQQTTASIATGVKNAIFNLQNLLAQADLAAKSLELAQSQYDLAKAQFDTGAISTLDLLTASVTLTGAQVSLAKARSDAQLGVLALQNAMGN